VAQIAPFRGVRYNPDKITFISRVVAPPYDVIDPDLDAALRERDVHNVVRLTLARTPPEGRPQEDYEHAASLLRHWMRRNVLVRDDEPALYVVEQVFRVGGREQVRWGLLSALLLEEFGQKGVYPHERTTEPARSDRLKLMGACRASLSPVLAISADPDGALDRVVGELRAGPVLYSFRDDEATAYTVWKVSDAEAVGKLVALMGARALFIADGHHRYESALEYRRSCRSSDGPPGAAPEDYIPALCISVANPGLCILPTHRCVSVPGELDARAVGSALSSNFSTEVSEVRGPETLQEDFDAARAGRDCVGCYLPNRTLCLLRTREEGPLRARFPDAAGPWWRLPVATLHHVILPDLMGIEPSSQQEAARITYSHDASEVYWAVESGKCTAGFLLPPTDPQTVQEVAARGERLPPKSTYFYPKIVSGLVLHVHTTQEGGPSEPEPVSP